MIAAPPSPARFASVDRDNHNAYRIRLAMGWPSRPTQSQRVVLRDAAELCSATTDLFEISAVAN